MFHYTRDIINEVRGMLERHWSVADIAARLNIDADDVRTIIDLINNLLT